MQQVYQLLFYTMKVSATVLLPRSLHYTDKEHRRKVIPLKSGITLLLYQYTDDSTLFCEIRSCDDGEAVAASLNRDLDRMKSWADKWKVTFELSKYKT